MSSAPGSALRSGPAEHGVIFGRGLSSSKRKIIGSANRAVEGTIGPILAVAGEFGDPAHIYELLFQIRLGEDGHALRSIGVIFANEVFMTLSDIS